MIYPDLYPGYGQLDCRTEYFDFVHFPQYVGQMFVQFRIKSLDREIQISHMNFIIL
jgi:hypothetical protein